MQTLATDELNDMLDQKDHTQLVAVYSSRYFETMHLPGSVNIPLKALPDRAEEELDPERPVIVYCSSRQCDLSPQAARRLRDLGFDRVYDYEGGGSRPGFAPIGPSFDPRMARIRELDRPVPSGAVSARRTGTGSAVPDLQSPVAPTVGTVSLRQ